jgi:hypothetical protein
MALNQQQMSTLRTWGATPPNNANTLRAFLGDMNGVMSGNTQIFDTRPGMGDMLSAQNGNFDGLINDGSMQTWVREVGGPDAASQEMVGMVTQMGANPQALLTVLDNPNQRSWDAPSQQMFASMMRDLRESDPALAAQLTDELREDVAAQGQTVQVSAPGTAQTAPTPDAPTPAPAGAPTPSLSAPQTPDENSFSRFTPEQQERIAAFMDAEVTITTADGAQEQVSRGSLIATALESLMERREEILEALGVSPEFRERGDQFWNRVRDGLDQAGIEPVPRDTLPGGSVLSAVRGGRESEREERAQTQETIYTQADYDRAAGYDVIADKVAAGVSPDNTPSNGIQREREAGMSA